MLMLPEATMFCTSIFGLSVIFTLIFFNCLITDWMTSLTWAMDFVPVQTSFPEEKTRTADFGFFTLRTRPGNCSGLYSVLLCVLANFVREMGFPKAVVATIFWILREVSGMVIYKEGCL